MSLRNRVSLVLLTSGVAAAAIFAFYSYRRATTLARQEAQLTGEMMLGRTVETFMVSTRRFDQEFRKAQTPEEKKRLLDDWNRTIAAVDTACHS